MGKVTIEVPGPGTYQVECDPRLPPLTAGGTAEDALTGTQFYNDQNQPVTGTMPDNGAVNEEVSGGQVYTVPRGYHNGAGTVTGTGVVLPALTAPAAAPDILDGKEAIDGIGKKLTGTMPDNGAVSAQLAAGGTYTIPKGYHNGQGKVTNTAAPLPSLTTPAAPGDILSGKEVIGQTGEKVTGTMPAAAQAVPEIFVDSAGLITASAAQSAGYVPAGTKIVTRQLDTQGAQVIVPGTADQAIPAGKFLTGAQTIQGDANLLPGNIRKDVSLFGVVGSYEPGLPEGLRTITLTANPPEGGTVSGGGVASDGMTLTVNAEPNEVNNYLFGGWKEQDTAVSAEPKYTFPVTKARSLIAVFNKSPYLAGRDWWASTLPSSFGWSDVAYGNGKFVAVAGGTDQAAYSEDGGATWKSTTLPASANWVSVTFGNGRFVALAYNSNIGAYSDDGITWHSTTMPSSANWRCLSYGNGKFVAVAGANKGDNAAAYSEDGITWKATTMPSSAYWISVTYGNGKFVAIANGSNNAAYSENGTTWKATTLPVAANRKSVAYGNGKFLTFGYGGNNAAYSENGTTWKATLPPWSSAYWNCVTFGNGKFVAIVEATNQAAYSEDGGATWKSTTLPASANWNKITFGNGNFVAIAGSIGTTNIAAYSSSKGPNA